MNHIIFDITKHEKHHRARGRRMLVRTSTSHSTGGGR